MTRKLLNTVFLSSVLMMSAPSFADQVINRVLTCAPYVLGWLYVSVSASDNFDAARGPLRLYYNPGETLIIGVEDVNMSGPLGQSWVRTGTLTGGSQLGLHEYCVDTFQLIKMYREGVEKKVHSELQKDCVWIEFWPV